LPIETVRTSPMVKQNHALVARANAARCMAFWVMLRSSLLLALERSFDAEGGMMPERVLRGGLIESRGKLCDGRYQRHAGGAGRVPDGAPRPPEARHMVRRAEDGWGCPAFARLIGELWRARPATGPASVGFESRIPNP
jgi:hypothetical protein